MCALIPFAISKYIIYINNRQRTVNVFTKISINRVLNEQKKQYEQLKRTCILCSILWFDTSTKPTKVTNTIMKPVESYRWPDTPATKKTVQQKINRNWGLGEWEQVKRKFPLVLKYAQSILAGGIVRLEMVLHYRHSMSAGLNLYLFQYVYSVAIKNWNTMFNTPKYNCDEMNQNSDSNSIESVREKVEKKPRISYYERIFFQFDLSRLFGFLALASSIFA